MVATSNCFNSRLREEATAAAVDSTRVFLVSTHASVRRRPAVAEEGDASAGVSTHASVRRRINQRKFTIMAELFQLTPP